MSESEALILLRQGKDVDRAFATLVAPIERALLGCFCRLTGNWHDAMEVRQHSYIAAFTHIRQFDPAKGSFYTWMWRIGENHWFDLCHQRQREQAGLALLARTAEVGTPGPAEQPVERLSHEQLWKMLSMLSAYELEAVELHWGEDLPYEEVGRLMGVSPRAAKYSAWSGMHKLRVLARLPETVEDNSMRNHD